MTRSMDVPVRSNAAADRDFVANRPSTTGAAPREIMSPHRNGLPEFALGVALDGGGSRRLLAVIEHRVYVANDLPFPPPYDARLADALRAARDHLAHREPFPHERLRFSLPFPRPGKVIALGRTFPAHARELGNDPGTEPLVFAKLAENLVASGVPVALPRPSDTVERWDVEIELAAVIANPLRRAHLEDAEAAIAGFTIVNDLTCRSAQARAKERGHPWFLAKNTPGGTPVGPWFVPAAMVTDPRALRVRCAVDGDTIQDTDTSGMMATPAELIAWLSHRVPLELGDLVALGTPPGTAAVSAGSEVVASIEGLGILRTDFVEEGIT